MDIGKIKELDDKSVQGEEALHRFNAVVGKILSVSREEVKRREQAHKDSAHLRGKKRGPKPKPVSSDASPETGAEA